MQGKLGLFYVTSAIVIIFNVVLPGNAEQYEPSNIYFPNGNKPIARIKANCETDSSACRRFKCVVFSDETPEIYWIFKPCLDDSCEYQNKSITSTTKGSHIMSEIDLDLTDSGYLKCVASNSNGETEVSQEIVPFNHTGQPFMNITEPEFIDFSPDEEMQYVSITWSLKIDGFPTPRTTLLMDDVEIISNDHRFQTDFHNGILSLIISGATKSDLNKQFRLNISNIYENKLVGLPFNTSDMKKPNIKVQFLNDTHSILSCESFSVQDLEISWYFSHCKREDYCAMDLVKSQMLKRLKLATLDFTEGTLVSSATISVNSSMLGWIICSVNNSVNIQEAYHEVEAINGSIAILGLDSISISIPDNETRHLVVEMSVNYTLICAVSAHNHTDEVYWWNSKLSRVYDNISEVKDAIFSKQRALFVNEYSTIDNYYCTGYIQNGKLDSLQIKIELEEDPQWEYYAIGLLVVTLAAITSFVIYKIKAYRRTEHIIGLSNFEKGALEHLNPNLYIEDQANLLPYDERYEFPLDQLKLGEQIGSGAFGVVMKGEAFGMFENEKSTQVAVKMANRTIGDVHIKALASELKILIHLGKHVNVVNLLGACTKNITKQELLVIVEYCAFGNLKDYLLNHRHTFVDQIDPATGKVDFSIGFEALNSNDSAFIYVTPSFFNQAYISVSKNADKKDKSNENLHKTDKPVCTRDLLLWSFQVARGMEYLSSRNVLHGDLAARNILLTHGNVVKICDFGLSRKMYHREIYKKTGDEMLPVKWIAIEAITDKIFSVQSDVWSFGIVLWELFSLAKNPYPGMEYNESFCEKLLNGYRMKSPQCATQEIYEIMLHCWEGDPTNRPSFAQLVERLGFILDEPMREHYIQMNTGYLKMNAQRFKDIQDDYLAMVRIPDYKSFSSYVDIGNSINAADEDTYI